MHAARKRRDDVAHGGSLHEGEKLRVRGIGTRTGEKKEEKRKERSERPPPLFSLPAAAEGLNDAITG